jgi:nucleoside-diphosphate-sugar epimerase
MKVLVTGGSGMLGSHVVAALAAQGHAVHSLDLRTDSAAAPTAHQHVGDIRDTALVKELAAGTDALVHCAAALPSYPADKIRSVVVDGTRSVLSAAEVAGTARVVHISSTAVYGLPKFVPTPEDHPRRPVDTYSGAKAEAELVAEEFRARGTCLTMLRPKTFLGPGRMGLFGMLFEWAEEGHNFPVLGRGDVRIQMLDVDDLVTAVRTALAAPREIANDTYNIAAERFGTLREDFQAVLDEAGHGKRVVSIPARPALAVLRLLGRSGLSPVYGRLLFKLLADSYVDTTKARERLGFRPEQSNRDAILRTFRSWRDDRATGAPAPAGAGRTSREPWRQGALSLAKFLF